MPDRRLGVAVIPAWYPTAAQPLSGIFVRDQVRAAARDSDVAVIVDDGPDPDVRGLYSLREGDEDGVRTFRIAYRRGPVPQVTAGGYLLGILAALWRLRRAGFHVDVLHAHVHRAAWAATIVGALLRRPVVVSEHSSEFGWTGIRPEALRRARIAFARADLVCPVSEYLRRQIEAKGIRARFRVVPNAVDTRLFAPMSPTPRAYPRAITVASMDPKKGLPHLLEALAALDGRHADLELDLVGDGQCRSEYEALAQRLGVADRVTFHGVQPKESVRDLMAKADFLVLPSLTENLPVTIIEAMACGLPVVASDVGGIPEMVDEDSGLLVAPGNSQALRTALDRMIDRHDGYDRALIAQRARDRWSLPVVGAIWTDVYRTVARERGRL